MYTCGHSLAHVDMHMYMHTHKHIHRRQKRKKWITARTIIECPVLCACRSSITGISGWRDGAPLREHFLLLQRAEFSSQHHHGSVEHLTVVCSTSSRAPARPDMHMQAYTYTKLKTSGILRQRDGPGALAQPPYPGPKEEHYEIAVMSFWHIMDFDSSFLVSFLVVVAS